MQKQPQLLQQLNTLLVQKIGRDRLEFLCSNTMNLPMQAINPFLWTYDLKAVLLQTRQESPDVMSFAFLPNQFWTLPQAGQHVTFDFLIDGEHIQRTYSISQFDEHRFWITVKAQGKVSRWMHAHLKPGMVLPLQGPMGTFTDKGQKQVILIAVGTGLTPILPLARSMFHQAPKTEARLYVQFSNPKSALFLPQLTQWKNQGHRVEIAYSRTPGQGDTVPILSQDLLQHYPRLMESHVYLCGPAGFQTQVRQKLHDVGFPMAQLWTEQFILEKHMAPELDYLPEVYFKAENCLIQTQVGDEDKTLLELGLAQGLNLEKGCQKGYCGTCKLVLHEGEVSGQTQGQAVYICSAYAQSQRVVLGR